MSIVNIVVPAATSSRISTRSTNPILFLCSTSEKRAIGFPHRVRPFSSDFAYDSRFGWCSSSRSCTRDSACGSGREVKSGVLLGLAKQIRFNHPEHTPSSVSTALAHVRSRDYPDAFLCLGPYGRVPAHNRFGRAYWVLAKSFPPGASTPYRASPQKHKR
jgi:hypothetical protein